ncbi:hypothetical protein CANCADRAFT_21518 [Tortispora caseinolytica NRRL Y-17796]|uniref:PHF5-like protein n=1 Tax=Tortispora caseinolytica NRRL Y-17796 TaxID=767744 RepID=A0A1E4TK35_9ASCO|nr:hypothetical protein CANCADRAFT_21518 [Tortispora caseinolytica NRRL Y-17796]
MSRHRPDAIVCMKQPGISVGKLCEKCDSRCPGCDAFVNPTSKARICDECSFGRAKDICILCGGTGSSDAYYCYECVIQEKDRDGCPRVISLGSNVTDRHFQQNHREPM